MTALQFAAVFGAVWLAWFIPESRRQSHRMNRRVKLARYRFPGGDR